MVSSRERVFENALLFILGRCPLSVRAPAVLIQRRFFVHEAVVAAVLSFHPFGDVFGAIRDVTEASGFVGFVCIYANRRKKYDRPLISYNFQAIKVWVIGGCFFKNQRFLDLWEFALFFRRSVSSPSLISKRKQMNTSPKLINKFPTKTLQLFV